jgi:hypothetical protein
MCRCFVIAVLTETCETDRAVGVNVVAAGIVATPMVHPALEVCPIILRNQMASEIETNTERLLAIGIDRDEAAECGELGQ